MDISRPCQPEKLIPLLPWPGFDPSFSGHNDRRAITSEWTRLRLKPLSHRGWPYGYMSFILDLCLLVCATELLEGHHSWQYSHNNTNSQYTCMLLFPHTSDPHLENSCEINPSYMVFMIFNFAQWHCINNLTWLIMLLLMCPELAEV